MAKVAGEADDHPHHKSVWFAHGDVNGVDFWSEKGSIKTTRVIVDEKARSVRLENIWQSGEKRICRDETTCSFGGTSFTRWIDFKITIFANESELLFGDTKEGLWAIRTRPGLQLTPDPKNGVVEVFGKASNSEGETGTAIWGKKAKWVMYEGKIDGVPVSIMMMDHPDNLRHPTTWHARDYGLVAANPFGLHDFLAKEKGAGEHRVPHGESIKFCYRLLLANLEQQPLDPVAEFKKFAEGKKN
jgi:Methane oxygenase PmoA